MITEADPTNPEQVATATLFNAYTAEFRSRVEQAIKQVLLVSGAIQTITIGAFLSGTVPAFSTETICLLKSGWLSLSISIIFCLLLMFLQLITQAHVVYQQVDKIRKSNPGLEIVNTHIFLRVLLWVFGVIAFSTCISGVALVSAAAMSLISV